MNLLDTQKTLQSYQVSPKKSVQASSIGLDLNDMARRDRLVAEARPLLNTHHRCKEIWHAMQQADFKRIGRLDDAAISIFFNRQRRNLSDLLLVESHQDLQLLIDEDEDGFWNEDEQILVFSLIKERLQNLASDLSAVFEYNLQKQLMAVIRDMEAQIVRYQEILRRRNHEKELQTYAEIGEQKLTKFNKIWQAKFASFQADKEQKMRQLEQRQETEVDKLEKELARDSSFVKIKPKARMYDLHTEEKLYAVSERFNEAQYIRNELRVLEANEQNRVQNNIIKEAEKKRKNLAIRHEKEVKQMQVKNETAYNNLKIFQEQEEHRLNKEIKLYYNDIKKNQNLATREAQKEGRIKDELRRTKFKARAMMQYLKESRIPHHKRTMLRRSSSGGLMNATPDGSTLSSAAPRMSKRVSTMVSTVMSHNKDRESPLKGISKSVTRFNIKSDLTGNYRPVNVEPDYSGQKSLSSRTMNLLDRKMTLQSTLPSIVELYNDNLQLLRETQ